MLKSNLDIESDAAKSVKSKIPFYRASVSVTLQNNNDAKDSKMNALADLHRGKTGSISVTKYFAT